MLITEEGYKGVGRVGNEEGKRERRTERRVRREGRRERRERREGRRKRRENRREKGRILSIQLLHLPLLLGHHLLARRAEFLLNIKYQFKRSILAY